MASPFKFYRKYTGVFMVFLTAMLMVAFGFGDLIGTGGGGGGSVANRNEVAVTWQGNKLTNGDLSRLVSERQVLKAFHDAVYQVGYQEALQQGTADLQLRVEPLRINPRRIEQEALDNKIIADAAREAGMAVGNDTVKEFLKALGRDYVSNDQLRLIVAQMKQGYGTRLSIEYLFDLIREALLARNYQKSYLYSISTVLPQQRYRDWLAVNDRVVVEAAALPVERYLSEVPEPTDVELEDFFDEYKDRQPVPDFGYGVELPSATPGFAIPRLVSLQFMRIDYQKALDEASEQITDEEIAAYYEENKTQFVKADDLLSGDSIGEDLFESDDEEEETDEEQTDEEQTDGRETEENEEGEENADSGDSEEEGQSSTNRSNPFRLVALQEDTDEEEATEDEVSDESDDEAEEVEYQPLDEVSDTIRQRLAEERATNATNDLANEIRSAILKDYNKYFTDVVAGTPEGETPPGPPASVSELKPIAEKHGLEPESLTKVNLLELRDTVVGKAVDLSRGNINANLTALLFASQEGEIDLYEPVVVTSIDTYDRYLVQQTDNQLAKTPELDEVRDQVVAAWKKKKAAELALEDAKKLATEARDAGDELAGFFSTGKFSGDNKVEVVETQPFSRMSVGLMNPQSREVPLRLSQPAEITAAGPGFMDAVFGLELDEITAVLNHDESIAYVIKINRHVESEPQLRQEFLSEGGAWFGQPAMDRARQGEIRAAFVQDLVGEDGVDWKRTPDEQRN